MKWQLFSFFSLLFLTSSCSSQDIPTAKVPSVVLNTLNANYSDATNVDWEKHNDLYEAEWEVNHTTDVTVLINTAGKIVMKKQDVSVAELTPAILTAIQNGYKGYTIDDVERIEIDGAIYFQFELDGRRKKDLHLVFSANGQEEKNIVYWD